MMRAVQLVEPKQFRLIDLPEPGAPAAGEALVRVHRVGICGTDISGYLGKMPFYSYPRIPGHELGVEVVAVGPGVTEVKLGDRCSVEPYLNCGQCFACQRGRSNCCESLQVLGVHTDGGLCSLLRLPARKLHPSSRLTFDQLALVETLGIGCHAVDRARPEREEDVLVVGAGPIGLATLEFVRQARARRLVLDLNEERLEFCRRAMGVADTIRFRGDGSELGVLKELTGGRLPSVVIDATGNRQSMSHALNYVAFTGKLVFVGITQSEIGFAQSLMHRRELTLFASRNALPADFRRIIGLMEEGAIDTRPWITHRTGFDGLIEAFASYTQPETKVIKAMVEIESSASQRACP